MLPRWARPLFALAIALVAWLVAAPARAAAPFCDQRGVSSAAPAPTLDLPTTSIDIAPSPEDECAGHLSSKMTFDDGRAPNPAPPPLASEFAVNTLHRGIPAAPPLFTPTDRSATRGARDAVCARLDRPPRL